MATNTVVSYPFDPEGTAPSNLITGEVQVLDPPNYSDFYFLIPRAAPFFANSLEIVKIDEARQLVRGQDYTPSYRFNDASSQCASDLYGAITILKRSMAGGVRMKYQTLGGPWTIDEQKILELLSNAQRDPRITTWEQVVEMPERFPPIDHAWDVVDMVGMSKVVEVLYDIVSAIQDQAGAALPAHVADKNNPHNVTKEQVLLGNVENYGIATLQEATAGVVSNKYMTPERVRQAMVAMLAQTLDVHTARQDNPHGVNAIQVGLGNVSNFTMATTPEAVAGTVSNKYMSPVLVKAAIDSQVMAILTPHVASTNNPHQTNKAQVQLGNVENYGIATVQEARAGTATDKYMTPALVREAISTQLLGGLDAHINDTSNPHDTNATQVGLGAVQNFGLATVQEAQAGTASNKYMTPALVRVAIEALGGADFNEHINDTSNPHQTDKIQIGLSNVENFGIANSQEAAAGVSTTKYMTPAMVKVAIDALSGVEELRTLIQNHAAARNPHGTTAGDVGAYTKTETDTLLAAKLGKTEKAADTSKMDGLTLAQLDNRLAATKIIPPPTNTTDRTWTALCAWSIMDPPATAAAVELVLNVTGGMPTTDGDRPQFRVSMSLNETALIRVDQLAGAPANAVFGAATVGTELVLYMLSAPQREAIGLSFVSNPGVRLLDSVVTVEPLGIYYSERVRHLSSHIEDDGAAGDIRFSSITYGRQDFGPMVEYLNVVDTEQSEDDTEVQTLESVLEDDILTFRPRAVYAGLLPTTTNVFAYDPLNNWVTSTPDFTVTGVTNRVLDSLTSRAAMTDYTIEVSLGSTSSAHGNALGLTIAEVRVGGQTFALQVLRTPGQTVVDSKTGFLPSTAEYGLMTVGINLMQEGSRVLSAVSGDGLVWGDGVIASDRDLDAQPYDQETSGWATPGRVRLRIVRTGNTITIETTNHGQTTYLTGGAKITLDLETDPLLSRFKDAPAAWGLLNFCQPQANFQVINRPDFRQPYAILSNNAGVDTSTMHRFNGAAWVTSDLIRSNPLVRPGRLVYSQWNGRLMNWRRDGSIRPLYIEAFTSSNRVALTE